MSWMIRTTSASTSRMWMYHARMWKPTKPISHATSKITNSVQSIPNLSFPGRITSGGPVSWVRSALRRVAVAIQMEVEALRLC